MLAEDHARRPDVQGRPERRTLGKVVGPRGTSRSSGRDRRSHGKPGVEVMSHAPHALVARLGFALVTLAGAAWLVVVAASAGAVALGLAPGHGFARALAALMLAPAAAAFAAPLIDASVALLRGRDRRATWTRIMTEALGALILAACATTLTGALLPGVAALAFAALLGYLFGFRHWHPQRLVAVTPASLPLLLLLDEPAGVPTDGHVIARPLPSERRAA